MNAEQKAHSAAKQRAMATILRELECDPEKRAARILYVVRAEMPSLEVKDATFATWVSAVRKEMGLPMKGAGPHRQEEVGYRPVEEVEVEAPPKPEPEPEPKPNPARDFPDGEIGSCLRNYGGWCGWLGDFPKEVIRALMWKASQGDELPEDLVPLRDAIAQFGHPPIEEAVARVQGLERAFAEIAGLLDDGGGTPQIERILEIREIVDSCVKYSGDFGVGRSSPSYVRVDARAEPTDD